MVMLRSNGEAWTGGADSDTEPSRGTSLVEQKSLVEMRDPALEVAEALLLRRLGKKAIVLCVLLIFVGHLEQIVLLYCLVGRFDAHDPDASEKNDDAQAHQTVLQPGKQAPLIVVS